MKITFVPDSSKAAQAKRCIRHKLYVPTWLMILDLQRMAKGSSDYFLVIAELNGKPVACATLYKYTKLINVFVLKSKRRLGIGRALVAMLELATGISRYAMDGSTGEDWSKEFYHNVGVFMPDAAKITLEDAKSGCTEKYRKAFKRNHLLGRQRETV